MAATFLVTGATGLVGFHIVLALLKAGHNVRYTARSEAKAETVRTNPAIERLAPGARLAAVLIPDFAVPGAFDAALADGAVAHVIHAGSPVPLPGYDPATGIYQPTLAITAGLLRSCLAAPSVRRVVVTSSVVANLGEVPGPEPVSAATRLPRPSGPPLGGPDPGYSAYVAAKIAELHQTDDFVRAHGAGAGGLHFSVSHVMPAYIYGRNELALDAEMMRGVNSSNTFLMLGMLGGVCPRGVLDIFCHLDDIVDLHVRVALDEEGSAGKDYGLAVQVDYETIFGIVQKAFPEAVEAGVFKRGTLPPVATNYDSSESVALLGGRLRSFESAVIEVAGQYLETLGREKA